MPYQDRFALVEDYIAHLDPMMAGIADPFIKSRYLGFIATSAVTAYELAIKDIFYAFADKKHVVLGAFARAKFEQMNGRIKLKALKAEHIAMFGQKYVTRFDAKIEAREISSLKSGTGSIKSSYGNVISWRNTFVHEGRAPATATYDELKRAYLSGKEVIHCLSETMVR